MLGSRVNILSHTYFVELRYIFTIYSLQFTIEENNFFGVFHASAILENGNFIAGLGPQIER